MSDFPFSDAVIHNGKVLETVLTGILPGNSEPISGGVSIEVKEIFRQLDAVLEEAGLSKKTYDQLVFTFKMSIETLMK